MLQSGKTLMSIANKSLVVIIFALLLPEAREGDGKGYTGWSQLTTAAETVADVKSFCAKAPNVCSAAQYISDRVEAKAKYSAQLLNDWAEETVLGHPKSLPEDVA
jgi:hypothetical protein